MMLGEPQRSKVKSPTVRLWIWGSPVRAGQAVPSLPFISASRRRDAIRLGRRTRRLAGDLPLHQLERARVKLGRGGGDDGAAGEGRTAVEAGDDAAGGGDDRHERQDVVGLQLALDHEVD